MWFPDGRSVLVLAGDGQRSLFYRVDSVTGETELLHTTTNRGLSSYRISPDGKTIFYCLQQDGVSETINGSILKVDISSRQETVLKQGEWFISLALSPDGSQLAYLCLSGRASSWYPSCPRPAARREVFRGSNWVDGSRYNTLAWSSDQRRSLFVTAA
jgi:Tol biopolymer transport system component